MPDAPRTKPGWPLQRPSVATEVVTPVRRYLRVIVLVAACLSAARPVRMGTWSGALDWKRLSITSADPFQKLMAEEFTGPPAQQATFAMGCFWRGEGELGSIDGVIGTVPGNFGSREVVKVTYNPAVVSYDQLLVQAKAAHVADDVFELSDRFQPNGACTAGPNEPHLQADDGPKFYLQQSPLRAVPMTPAQACRVDGALLHHQSPLVFLSPAQRRLAAEVLAAPDVDRPNKVGVPIDQAWAGVDAN